MPGNVPMYPGYFSLSANQQEHRSKPSPIGQICQLFRLAKPFGYRPGGRLGPRRDHHHRRRSTVPLRPFHAQTGPACHRFRCARSGDEPGVRLAVHAAADSNSIIPPELRRMERVLIGAQVPVADSSARMSSRDPTSNLPLHPIRPESRSHLPLALFVLAGSLVRR